MTPARGRDDDVEAIPLERIMRIADFRAGLAAFLRQSEGACRAWNLTSQQYVLLLSIKGAPDGSERLTFTDISKRLQLSRNTVTGLCARAEGAGLLRREPSQTDLRVTYLRLTDEGERRLLGAIRDSDRYRRELLSAFETLAETFRLAVRLSPAGR